MKEFSNIMLEDYRQENFTTSEKIVYGAVAPLCLILICLIV